MASQILDHFFIMDDRSVSKYLLLSDIVLSVVYYCCTLHSKAESCCFCKFDTSYHAIPFCTKPFLLPYLRAQIRFDRFHHSYHFRIVMSELSTRTASSACFNGAISRSYLCGHGLRCHVRSLPDYSLPLFLQFLITSLCSRLNACRQIYFHIRIRKNTGSDVSSVHDYILCLCQILL